MIFSIFERAKVQNNSNGRKKMSFLAQKIFFLIRLFICGGMPNFAALFVDKGNA